MENFIKTITNFFLGIIEKLDDFQEELKRKRGIDIPVAKIVGVVLFVLLLLFVAKLVLGIVYKFLFGS